MMIHADSAEINVIYGDVYRSQIKQLTESILEYILEENNFDSLVSLVLSLPLHCYYPYKSIERIESKLIEIASFADSEQKQCDTASPLFLELMEIMRKKHEKIKKLLHIYHKDNIGGCAFKRSLHHQIKALHFQTKAYLSFA